MQSQNHKDSGISVLNSNPDLHFLQDVLSKRKTDFEIRLKISPQKANRVKIIT